MIHEMDTEIVNSTEISNYFNGIIEESLNCGQYPLSKAEYDPDAPELYFTQWLFSMGTTMAKRTKILFEKVQKKECKNCVVMTEKLEKMNSKMSDVTKRYEHLISLVYTLDPVRAKSFVDSQQMAKPCTPKRGENAGRIPLSPIQSSAGNIARNRDISAKYFSPRQLPRNSECESQFVGSPNHCSTQNSVGLKYDENMKIKNSLTPKKKKKEISPLKPAVNNIIMSPTVLVEHKVGASLNDDSFDDSVDILLPTPPESNIINQKHVFKKEVKISVSAQPNDNIEDMEGDEAMTPIIRRASETMDALQRSKTPDHNDKYDETGISPSIMADRIPVRNLMGSFGLGTLELEPESSSKCFPRNSRISSQFSPSVLDITTTTPPSKVENSRKGNKNGWVTTDTKKGNKSLLSSINFKPPPNKGTKFKQMTLLQMKKKAAKDVNVDISTLEEFDGGVWPNSLKRKSDEKKGSENTLDTPIKNCARSNLQSADETRFEEIAFQDLTKQSSSKVFRREKKDLNTTANLIADLDRLPNNQSQEPAFAYKPERAIRKKEERAKLPGWDCDDCRKYYEAVGIDRDPSFIQQMKNQCSKHRAKHPANLNGTPPGFWDIDIPSTLELKKTKAFRTDTFVHSDDDDHYEEY